MSSATQSTETLFQNWRRGDAQAGQAMAQRFTDWYFAISACRLGEDVGDAAFREACGAFSRGVGRVADARRLLGWAHGIVREQLYAAAEGRMASGDPPNAWTRRQPPMQLLQHAREAVPDAMNVLEHAYRDGTTADPQRLLQARYALKRWLRDRFEIPFRVLPQRPDPDRAPLPFYEAGHMADENEQTHFELYMLTDMEVCQDVAEFAHYAIALRTGLPGEIPAPRPRRTVSEEETTQPAIPHPSTLDAPRLPAGPAAPQPPAASGLPTVVWAAIVIAGALAIVLVGLYLFLL